MNKLLYKELKLAWHPAMFLFYLCGALLLIPSWLYFIAFGYLFIAINSEYFLDKSNNDILFTAALPVRKRDIARSKTIFMAVIELLQIVVAIPFAIINSQIYPMGNMLKHEPQFRLFRLCPRHVCDFQHHLFAAVF